MTNFLYFDWRGDISLTLVLYFASMVRLFCLSVQNKKDCFRWNQFEIIMSRLTLNNKILQNKLSFVMKS